MSTYTVTTTDLEDQALGWAAGPGVNTQEWFDSWVHNQLATWTLQYQATIAPVPTRDVASAYLLATPEQQKAAMDALGMPPPAVPIENAVPPDPWMHP